MKNTTRATIAACLGLAVLPALAGCKIESAVQLKTSQLAAQPAKTASTFKVEVAACRDSDDSSKPSDSLQKAQKSMAELFPDSSYLECRTDDSLNSMASFSVPFETGTLAAGQKAGGTSPALMRMSGSGGTAAFSLPAKAAKSLSDQDDDLVMEIEISLTNDGDGDFTFHPVDAFIDGRPLSTLAGVPAPVVLKKGQSASIRLSNVAGAAVAGGAAVPIWCEDPEAAAKWQEEQKK